MEMLELMQSTSPSMTLREVAIALYGTDCATARNRVEWLTKKGRLMHSRNVCAPFRRKEVEELATQFGACDKYDGTSAPRKTLAYKCRTRVESHRISLQLYEHRQRRNQMSPVPYPKTLDRTKSMWGQIPCAPGIYFLWLRGIVVYVGQAVILSNRVTNCHEHINHYTLFSWLECAEHDLNFWEAYYIWLTRPELNFGRRKREKS